MNKFWALFLLLSAASLTLSCGTASPSRQLQSITISQNANGGQIEFVATGTFSAPPVTVSPLPVFWSYAPPPGQYDLTAQPFTFQCDFVGVYSSPLIAWAPPDPSAPSSGSLSPTAMINASAQITCP
jgi:hypothetical protein